MTDTSRTGDSAPAVSLLDPQSCGEDLAHNAERFSALAPRFCLGCADYHIRIPLHRYASPRKLFDRPDLIRVAGKIIADKAAKSQEAIEIAIAGSADTAMIATVAHAAAALGGEILKRCRFTVLDRCRTPLLVCEEFAQVHGLNTRACQGDLMSMVLPGEADLIVMHSLLRFIPHASQAALLRQIGSWLAPHGRLILSNRVLFDDDGAEAEGEVRKRRAAIKAVERALTEGRLSLAEPAETTLDRLERSFADEQGLPGEFRSFEQVRKVIGESGLVEKSLEGVVREFPIASEEIVQRRRVLAVLGPTG